jgi:hypothetical protein
MPAVTLLQLAVIFPILSAASGSAQLNEYRVLLIGPRRDLVEVLRKRQIPFSIWLGKAAPYWKDAEKQDTTPLWKSTDRIRQTIRREFGGSRFTHVIAGTEAAIYPATIARRVLGARCSETTTALRCRDKLAMKEYLCDFGVPTVGRRCRSSIGRVTCYCNMAAGISWKNTSPHPRRASSRLSATAVSASPSSPDTTKRGGSISCPRYSLRR